MQFSEHWLRAFCNPPLDSDELCRLLTMAGLEVEEVATVAPPFSGVVIARILAFEKHPNADKLNVCAVDVGQDAPIQIVCGAPNVSVGMKAPCALVGAKLPGFDIKAAKLRGVASSGMLCSASELGISQDHSGLMVLPVDAPVGANLREFLDLDDKQITIKLTPNRADCLSVFGIARELAALSGSAVEMAEPLVISEEHSNVRPIVLDAPEGCPRYCGRIIRGIRPDAPTPDWMKSRLARSGIRAISAAVDVTNFVMLEMGQPLHAFDNDKLQGAIHVRWPNPGDTLTLLNGQQIEVQPDTLLIADESRVLALAGVMGGEDSGVTDATRDVFLESAFFQPDAIVGRARALGFSSDASHRFERGVDFELARHAMERATQLIVDICGGSVGPVVEAVSPAHLPARPAVKFRPDRARRVLGFEIVDEAMEAALSRLGMAVVREGGSMQVTPPSYRFDIAVEEDLIEEVARVYGYENIEPATPRGLISMLASSEQVRPVHRVRRALAASGYQEVVSYAFVDAAWELDFAGNDNPVKLANPIASQMSVMRSSLIGGLIGALTMNIRRRITRARLFEVGRCFRYDTGGAPVAGYAQPVRLAGLAWGAAAPEQWGLPDRKADFYDVKHDVEVLLRGRASFRAARHPALHPGRSADVVVDGAVVGFMGELHPALVQKHDLVSAPVLFELALEAVLADRVPVFAELHRHPAVMRDMALVVRNSVTVDALMASLRAAQMDIVRSIEVFDVYAGKGIDPEHKSIALHIMLQHAERTLEDTEVDKAMSALLAAAEAGVGATLRT